MEELKTKNRVLLKVAEPSDLFDLYRLVDTYELGIEIDRDRVKNSLREMLYIHGVMLAEYNGVVIGGLAGYAIPSMLNDEIIYACMFLYVKKEYRHLTREFIKEFELTLLPTKAKRVTFAALHTPDGKKLQRFFRMLGYQEIETHFAKRF